MPKLARTVSGRQKDYTETHLDVVSGYHAQSMLWNPGRSDAREGYALAQSPLDKLIVRRTRILHMMCHLALVV